MEIIRRNGDVRDLSGNGRAVTDSNAHIGLGQRRGIVDAIPNHDDRMAFRPFRLHKAGLIRRQNFRMVFVHPYLCGNGGGGALAVSGEHNGPLDAQAAKLPDHGSCFWPQGIGDTDHSGQHAADGQIQMGILIRQGIVTLLFPLWNGTVFVLKDKVGASDNHTPAIDFADNAVGHNVLHLGVHFLMGQPPLPCGLDNRVSHGMGEMLLQASGQPQHIRLILPYVRRQPAEHDESAGAKLKQHKKTGPISLGAGFSYAVKLVSGDNFRQRYGP